MKLATSDTFKNVKSLTIFNFQDKKQICEMKTYFSTLTHLILRYNGEIDFHKVSKIFEVIPSSIKRLEICCDSISCSHYRLEHLFTKIFEFNKTVESFMLYVNYISRSLVNMCIQAFAKCVLRTITDFIRIMLNIRYVRIILNQSGIEALLDVIEWVTLLDICRQLEKITLKGMTKMSSKNQLVEIIDEIVENLHCKRESVTFEVQIK